LRDGSEAFHLTTRNLRNLGAAPSDRAAVTWSSSMSGNTREAGHFTNRTLRNPGCGTEGISVVTWCVASKSTGASSCDPADMGHSNAVPLHILWCISGGLRCGGVSAEAEGVGVGPHGIDAEFDVIFERDAELRGSIAHVVARDTAREGFVLHSFFH
jgi:hypothetical protein